MNYPPPCCVNCGLHVTLQCWSECRGELLCEPCGVEKERLERLAYGR